MVDSIDPVDPIKKIANSISGDPDYAYPSDPKDMSPSQIFSQVFLHEPRARLPKSMADAKIRLARYADKHNLPAELLDRATRFLQNSDLYDFE